MRVYHTVKSYHLLDQIDANKLNHFKKDEIHTLIRRIGGEDIVKVQKRIWKNSNLIGDESYFRKPTNRDYIGVDDFGYPIEFISEQEMEL